MKRIRFIINPISGTGKQKAVEKLIEAHLDASLFQYEISYTEAPKHATALSKEAVENNYDAVVAVGGDGSVNETATGLAGSNTALAIIPTGSGNGLARHLNIPMDLAKAMKLINHFKVKNIDSVTLNDATFFGTAGVGFDAFIGWKFSQHGRRGFFSYAKLVMKEFRNYQSQDYELTIDGEELHRKAFLIGFANASQYGNNARIVPMAVIDDGWLDICILKKFPFIAAPGLLVRLFRNSFHRSRYVEMHRGKEILLKQQSKLAHIDGEPIEAGSELHIKVKPLSLNVIVP